MPESKVPAELISVPTFAQRHGVSKVAAYTWLKKGWLVLEGKLVNVEKSELLLAIYRDPADGRAARGDKPAPPASPVVPTPPRLRRPRKSKSPEDAVDPDAEEFAEANAALTRGGATTEEARRVKENYLALKAKQEFEQGAGKLVDMVRAEAVLFESARAVRNTWLGWPSKYGALIAADLGLEADKVTAVLTAYVHRQVAQLGEPDADFAG